MNPVCDMCKKVEHSVCSEDGCSRQAVAPVLFVGHPEFNPERPEPVMVPFCDEHMEAKMEATMASRVNALSN